ncbi:hypothetical protein IJ750_05700 [bacterium]|nr:hypothetical protein [bacterium]
MTLELATNGYEFDIDSGNLSRIENFMIGCKFITIRRIAEGLGMTFPEFVQILYDKLVKDFKLINE